MSDVDVEFGMDTVPTIQVVFAKHVTCTEIEIYSLDETVGLRNLQLSTCILETREKWLAKS